MEDRSALSVAIPTAELFVLRHGETEWNVAGRLQGRCDSALTAAGEEQAKRMADLLDARLERPSRLDVFTSPLRRATRTAEILCERLGGDRRPRLHVEPALAELSFGDWEGCTRAEIEARSPGCLAARAGDLWRYRPPGGESYHDVHQRVAPWLEGLASQGPLLIVTHEVVSRVLRAGYLDLEPGEVGALHHRHGTVYRLADGAVEALDSSVPACEESP